MDALEFLVGLLHNKPELIPKDFPWTWWDGCPADSTTSKRSMAAPDLCQGQQIQTISTTAPLEDISQKPLMQPDSSNAAIQAQPHAAANGAVAAAGLDAVHHAANGNAPSSLANGQPSPAPQHGNCSVSQQGPQHAAQQAQQAESPANDPTSEEGSQSQSRAGQGRQRRWKAAPYLGPEIEEAHATAIAAGQSTYTDPATGYKVVLLCLSRRTPWSSWCMPDLMYPCIFVQDS